MASFSLVVRAITFFTGKLQNASKVRDEVEYAVSVIDDVSDWLVRNGYEVFTKRISLPAGSWKLAARALEYLGRDVLLSSGFIEEPDEASVVELLESGVYTPILHRGSLDIEAMKKYSQIIHRVSRRDPQLATRIAIGFYSEDLLTPYFPGSSSRGERVLGLAFIYPSMLEDLLKKGMGIESAIRSVFREFEKIAKEISSRVGLKTLIDYSLSPWMDHSVARLLEALGARVAKPGFNYVISMVNAYIEKHASREFATGFNEVMLPYAEDLELIRYGEKGIVKARDFLLYATTCVAGVDMVVVPEDVDSLAKLIADTAAIALMKKKPVWLRAIPVNLKPGEKVKLGRFGEVAVLDY